MTRLITQFAPRFLALAAMVAIASACAADPAPDAAVLLNDLETPLCTVQAADCGSDTSVDLVTEASPMQPGDRLSLPAGECLDVFVVSCDGEEMMVIAVDERAAHDTRLVAMR